MSILYERTTHFEPGCSITYKLMGIATRLTAHNYFSLQWIDAMNVPERGPVVLVSNHQTYLDPLFVAAAIIRRVDFLTLESSHQRRSLGWWLNYSHCIPITGHSSAGGFRTALRRLAAGGIIGVFPEGERSRDGTLGPFTPAPLLLASRSEAPIVPIRISGGMKVYPRDRRVPRRGTVSIAYGAPWTVPELPRGKIARTAGTDALTAELRDRISALPGRDS